jgi:hypothetical protein
MPSAAAPALMLPPSFSTTPDSRFAPGITMYAADFNTDRVDTNKLRAA